MEKKLGTIIIDGKVVDLDNTLLKGNSTILLTSYLLKKLLRESKLSKIIFLFNIILKRKLRHITHKHMKHRIVSLYGNTCNKSDNEKFVDILIPRLNKKVINILEFYHNQGYHILVASAAADFFLGELVSRLESFKADFIGTPFSTNINAYIENKGEVKLKNVISYLKNKDLELKVMITDHEDDLPLLKYNRQGKNYLVNSSRRTRRNIKKVMGQLPERI